jgi:hypothetical protein
MDDVQQSVSKKYQQEMGGADSKFEGFPKPVYFPV